MKVFTQLCPQAATASETGEPNVTELLFEQRQRSRLHVTVKHGPLSGQAVGINLPRGNILRNGQLLTNEDGEELRVDAAPESQLVVSADTPQALATLAYHLGNRHVPVQISENSLSLAEDAVLAEMITGLGGTVEKMVGPFEPESGAYKSGQTGSDESGGHHHGHHHHHGDEKHAPRIHDLSGPQ
jgi:urease accessory protein